MMTNKTITSISDQLLILENLSYHYKGMGDNHSAAEVDKEIDNLWRDLEDILNTEKIERDIKEVLRERKRQ